MKNDMNINYYLIHNLDQKRYENMVKLFSENNISLDNVKFINHPNKNELTYEIKRKVVQKNSKIPDGWISCSYKHYLALEDIVRNNIEMAVIMEDNIGGFYENVQTRIKKYLQEMDEDWDIIFDSIFSNFDELNEGKVTEDKLVYLKKNSITKNSDGKIIAHGATRAAQFYLVNFNSAKKLYENFIPFNHSADMWMNSVIRKLDLKAYWSEPSLVTSKFNSVSSTLHRYDKKTLKQITYIVKSRIINKLLRI
jgi:GR25 family glycosyltransferase involved in LPS biosynthesis